MSDVTAIELVIYGIIGFFVSIFSGIAGAGGGFIATPLLIFLGLSPAQAVATVKVSGLSIAVTSIGGLRGVKREGSKRSLAAIIAMAIVIGLLAPNIIVNMDSEVYRRTLSVLLLLMIPVLIVKKVGHEAHEASLPKKIGGYVLLALSMGLQAVFSGGLGTLVVIVLMGFLGMSALEANITKRYSQIVLNVVVVLGLVGSGLIVWKVAAVGVVAAGSGGYIGTRLAVKKGNRFVMTIFIILMFISAIELWFGAG